MNVMDELFEKALQDATQEAASLRNLREKFLILAEGGDKTAMAHIRLLEERELEARQRIKQLHFGRLPLA